MSRRARADVLIIGAGAAGGVVGRRLAEAGMDVLCLEQGDWPDRADYPGPKPDWELQAMKQWAPDPNVRGGPADYPIDVSASDIVPLMYSGVGGSTVLYAGDWPRLTPSDFRVRSLDGVADDWPLTYEELEPSYDRIARQVGVAGLRERSGLSGGRRSPAAPAAARPRRHGRGARARPAGLALVARAVRDPLASVRGAAPVRTVGLVHAGLPGGCEGVDRRHALATGDRARCSRAHTARARPGCCSARTDSSRERSTSTRRAGPTARKRTSWCSPRTRSAARGCSFCPPAEAFPDGLANTSGLVGRRLMMHPFAVVTGVFEESLETWRGNVGSRIHSLQFYESDERRGFVRGAKWSLAPSTGGPMNAAMPARAGAAVWGDEHHARVRERFGHCLSWGIFGEDLPDESNRVTLDPVLVDASGVPAPRVSYRASDNSRRLLDFHVERARESLLEAGARSVDSLTLMRSAGWHLLGTARMGTDPATSVVDPWGRAHDVDNLYVVDGSVFVTAGGVNPTNTICALALRFADRLVERRAHQRVPA